MTAAQRSRISKLLADPTRFQLLRHISEKGRCTCSDVRERLGVTPATLSHHLKELEQAGLVTVRREGRFAVMQLKRDVWKSYIRELSSL